MFLSSNAVSGDLNGKSELNYTLGLASRQISLHELRVYRRHSLKIIGNQKPAL
jgi:hypothetical protein